MIEAAIKYGIQLTVVVLTVCVIGIMAASQLPIQMIPDLDVRTITVQTSWPGATPQDVEKEILIQQEDYLRTITGMSRMVSEAETGSARVELEFPFGVDINEALIKVNNALSQVPSYPANVDEPRLYATSFSSNAFMFFRIEPMPDYPVKLDMVRLRDYIDDFVRPRMERVPGVSEVRVVGGADRQIQIRIDPNRLAATGVTLGEVRTAIRARNQDFSAGDLDLGKRRYLVRTVGRFDQVEELNDLIIDRQGDALVRLGDVADISLEHFEVRRKTYVDGRPTINLFVRKEVGSNVIQIKDAMMPVVDEVNRELLEPARLLMHPITDDVRYVKSSIRDVWRNLMIGTVLATLVMLLFLRSVSATLVGVVGIPICAIAAFIGLLIFDRTVNVISLAGIAFAIGMTLDNSIVVLESIERRRKEGMERFAAALAGVRRVWPAVLASTLTTVLVFVPVWLDREEAGQLFSDIAIGISASILASLLVAVTVIPSAAARVRLGTQTSGPSVGGALKATVVGAIGWLIRGWVRSAVVAGSLFVGAILIIRLLMPAGEYLPPGEEAKTFSFMIAPAGYNLDEMVEVAEVLHDDFVPYIGDDPGLFARSERDVPGMDWIVTFVYPGRILLIAETTDPTQIEDLMAVINTRFREFPGMRGFSSRGSIISDNQGGSRSVNLNVSGPDLQDIYRTATLVYRRAAEVFENPEINSDPPALTLAQPLIELHPNWTRAAELGFTADEFGFAVAALTDGAYVDEFLLDGERVDMFLFSTDGTEQSLDDLPMLPLYTPREGVVPVGAVADIIERVDTDTIRRLDGRRTVTLHIIPERTVALETAVEMVRTDVVGHLRRTGQVPDGVSMNMSGASTKLEITREALQWNFLISLLLSYFLLVAIFSRWFFPFVIMTTVPLGVAGGIAGLWLLNQSIDLFGLFGIHAIHQPFDMITMMGFIILLGTVVNNPILIVDQTLHNLREQAMAPHDAVREALAVRLRPMMMSTITTVFGILPLVVIPGAGTELYRGVGAIVLFGLLFATFITIVFLPPLLTLVLRLAGLMGLSRDVTPAVEQAPAAPAE